MLQFMQNSIDVTSYKMADNGRLTVDQKVKVILFYAETKSVVATQRLFVHTLVQGGLLANRQFTDFH